MIKKYLQYIKESITTDVDGLCHRATAWARRTGADNDWCAR